VNLRAALRRRTKYTLVTVSIAVGVLACLWVVRFLWLLTMGNELIILPFRVRVPGGPLKQQASTGTPGLA
jgi:hypothetical protein